MLGSIQRRQGPYKVSETEKLFKDKKRQQEMKEREKHRKEGVFQRQTKHRDTGFRKSRKEDDF